MGRPFFVSNEPLAFIGGNMFESGFYSEGGLQEIFCKNRRDGAAK